MTNTIETKPLVSKEEITVRAYLLWEKAGRPAGRDLEFWAEAEQQLMTNRVSAAQAPLKAPATESAKAVIAVAPATRRGTTTVVAAAKPAKVKTSLPKTRKKSARF